jgi:hypothetical protein
MIMSIAIYYFVEKSNYHHPVNEAAIFTVDGQRLRLISLILSPQTQRANMFIAARSWSFLWQGTERFDVKLLCDLEH